MSSNSESDLQITLNTNNSPTPTSANSNTSRNEDDNKRKAGRKSSDIWSFFTNDKEPRLLKSAICKHCKLRINHHKKSEYAKNHLLKCIPFKNAMYGIEFEERPEWFPSKKILSRQGKF